MRSNGLWNRQLRTRRRTTSSPRGAKLGTDGRISVVRRRGCRRGGVRQSPGEHIGCVSLSRLSPALNHRRHRHQPGHKHHRTVSSMQCCRSVCKECRRKQTNSGSSECSAQASAAPSVYLAPDDTSLNRGPSTPRSATMPDQRGWASRVVTPKAICSTWSTTSTGTPSASCSSKGDVDNGLVADGMCDLSAVR